MKKPMKRVLLFALIVLVVLLARPAAQHARAAAVLRSFSDAAGRADVVEERLTFGDGVPARLYAPRSGERKHGIVLVHGVQYLGIEEPRLERLARSLAREGVVVFTPAVTELSDYRVAPHSIETIGAAVVALRERLGTKQVGLMGTSFGGGLSLLAASDPRWASRIGFVVAVGAHDDLGRVSRFFLDNETPTVDGGTRKLRAHGYGTMVLVYSRAADFFAPADVKVAEDSLRSWLHEDRDAARKTMEACSAECRARLAGLFGEGGMHDEIARALEGHAAEMAAVSPHGRLGGITANVYLLHGEGDTVIPATETEWLAHDVPAARLRTALISPAIEHVELRSPGTWDMWQLVHFMGEVIAEADAAQ